MPQDKLNAVVLADSRGLDTYYINDAYAQGYGIDRVFGYRIDGALRTQGIGNVQSVLIPDHFRGGTIEGNITRIALCRPKWVILCDGIWETLLNREKYLTEAQGAGLLKDATLESMNTNRRDEFGAILNRLYFEDRLSISPAKYGRKLDTLIGYFARRRCRVMWLSLLVPPETHRNGVHAAGAYRPLPFWQDRLRAINEEARTVLDRWGGLYVDLNEGVAHVPSLDHALIDQWHFSDAFHGIVADQIAGHIRHDLTEAASPHSSWDPDCMTPPGRGRATTAVAGIADLTGDDAGTMIKPGEAVILKNASGDRDAAARAILDRFSAVAAVLYPEECGQPADDNVGGRIE